MESFTRHAVTLLVILLSVQVTSAQAPTEGEGDAVKLADTIREFNEAFGDIVDGEMTPTQIAEFERMIAPAFDVAFVIGSFNLVSRCYKV